MQDNKALVLGITFLIGLYAGRYTKTEMPKTPEVVHKYEQMAKFGYADGYPKETVKCKTGMEFLAPAPGRYEVCVNPERVRIIRTGAR